MSNQCCPTKSICVDPASPIQNFSTEAPDLTLFIGSNGGWDNSDGGYNTPSIGGTWNDAGCAFTCLSTKSQADADQCAANQQLACADNSWQTPPGTPVVNAFNLQSSCQSLCPDGLPFTFTIPAGSILAPSQARANEIAFSFACTSARARRICLSSLESTDCCANSPYTGTIVASGGMLSASNNIWSVIAGSLPFGLSFPTATGPTLQITGSPTNPGTYNFTLQVTAPNGDFQTKSYTLCVIAITPTMLPNASNGIAYSQPLTAQCGTAPFNWQVTSGSLPPGLTLDQQQGIISGTPTMNGSFTFTITLQTSAT